MAELSIETVPCYVHSNVQEEELPVNVAYFPFSKDFLDGLGIACPVVSAITPNENELDSFQSELNSVSKIGESALALRRISHNHGRSYEITTCSGAEPVDTLAIWSDEYRNRFSSLSLKGNNFSDPRVFESLTAPSGYIPFGLLESDALKRVIRASRLMRENGIDTEMILRVFEPKYFRYPSAGREEHEYVTLPEFKRRLLSDHFKSLKDKDNISEEFSKVAQAIGDMSFFITLRAMSCDIRLSDFIDVREEKDCLSLLAKVFKLINTLGLPEKFDLPRFDLNNSDSIKNYLHRFLPSAIGFNLGKLHKAGLLHTFPVIGNVTALGGLVDLDSVRGEPLGLGDVAPTEEEYIKELDLYTHNGSIEHLDDLLNLVYPQALKSYNLGGMADSIDEFTHNMTLMYLVGRFGLGKNLPPDILLEVLTHATSIARTREVSFSAGYELKLREILAFDEYPDMLSENQLKEIHLSIRKWLPELKEVFGEVFVENSEEVDRITAVSLAAEVKAVNSLTAMIMSKIDEFLKSPSALDLLDDWIGNQKKEDSDWDEPKIRDLFLMFYQQQYYDEIYQRLSNSLSLMFSGLCDKIDTDTYTIFNVEEALRPRYSLLFMDGKLGVIRPNISLPRFLVTLPPNRGASKAKLEPFRVSVDPTLGQNGGVLSTPKDQLREVIFDGDSHRYLFAASGELFSGDGELALTSASTDEYLAHLTFNPDTRKLTPHITLSDEKDLQTVIDKLKFKGYPAVVESILSLRLCQEELIKG